MKTEVIVWILVLIIISLTSIQSSQAEEITINLKSATHEKTTNVTEIFVLDDNYYLTDMKDDKKILYLNFTNNLTNNSTLKIYAKKDKSITIGIYALSDTTGTNPLGIFTVTSTTGTFYNITLNLTEPTNTIWIGEGTGSGIDPREYFDYIYATTIIQNTTIDTTPPPTITNLINISTGLDFIYWTWTNPIEPDFLNNLIYLDNINIINTSNNYYNATSLQENTEYTIKIHTIDTNSNINTTDITHTVRTIKNTTEENNENPGGGPSGGSGEGGSAPSSIYQSSVTEQSSPEISEQEPISNTNEQKTKQPKTKKSQEAITSYTIKQPSFINKNLNHIITAIIMTILAGYIYRKQVKDL